LLLLLLLPLPLLVLVLVLLSQKTAYCGGRVQGAAAH
jgi:hypothetical protein